MGIIREKLTKSIEAKVLAPVVLGALAVVGISTTCMLYIKAKNTELVGLTTARVVAQQAASVRKYYTNEVVPRAKKAGMKADFDFDQRDNTLPAPATLTKVLGEEIGKMYPGSKIRLYSRLPFLHRAGTETYDTFEQETLTALEKNPQQPYARLETVDGRLSMRYAIADIMQPACVGCHNNNTIQSETNEAVTAMEESTREVVSGSRLADQAGQTLVEIEGVSNRLAELIQSISLASKQQARGSEGLSKAMGEISDVTQQTAAGTKQAAASINNLVVLADDLRQSVSTFKLPGSTNGHH